MNKNSKSKRIGLYITVIFHLTVIAFLMGYSLKSTIERTDEILVDLMTEKEMEELQKLEEQMKLEELTKKGEAVLQEQQLQEIKNIAVDRSGQLKDDRGTDSKELYRQHEELMKELEKGKEQVLEEEDDQVAVPVEKKQEPSQEIPNFVTEGLVTIEFNVDGRRAVHYRIPAYKCMNGGMVVVQVNVGRNGKVTSAHVIEEQSSPDPCLHDAAVKAAYAARFNASAGDSERKAGTITFGFIPQ